LLGGKANEPLQGGGVALRHPLDGVGAALVLVGIDEVGGHDAIAVRAVEVEARHTDHQQRDVVFEGEQGDGLVRGSRPAKEVDEQPTLSRVLVCQRRDGAAGIQHVLDVVEITFLGEDLLAGPLAQLAHVVVEERIVERARNRVSVEAEQAQGDAGDLPVAKMSRHDQQRPARDERADDAVAADQLRVLLPGVDVQPARHVDDLDEQRAEVDVDLTDHDIALLRSQSVSKSVDEVLVGAKAMFAIHLIGEPAEQPRHAAGPLVGEDL